MGGGKPRRWRISGCADDDSDVVLLCETDGACEPVEIVMTLRRFECAPGKFTHPNYVQVSIFHELQVRFPARLWPLLGIPGCTEQQGRNVGIGILAVNGKRSCEQSRHGKGNEFLIPAATGQRCAWILPEWSEVHSKFLYHSRAVLSVQHGRASRSA